MIGGQTRSGTASIKRARRAAGMGDSVMVLLEGLGQTLSPMPALAAIAAATRTIHFDTDELANDLRHPWCWHATPPRARSFPTGASSWVLGAGYHVVALRIVGAACLSRAIYRCRQVYPRQ